MERDDKIRAKERKRRLDEDEDEEEEEEEEEVESPTPETARASRAIEDKLALQIPKSPNVVAAVAPARGSTDVSIISRLIGLPDTIAYRIYKCLESKWSLPNDVLARKVTTFGRSKEPREPETPICRDIFNDPFNVSSSTHTFQGTKKKRRRDKEDFEIVWAL
ncbi:hypothetical protein V1477_019848 [Vespula maculifrons]|uniref:Uncharacterized protein n=1 Tax=Vespula maculifrons TaxID=7453 RepID=A0ABD2AK87_VESMC